MIVDADTNSMKFAAVRTGKAERARGVAGVEIDELIFTLQRPSWADLILDTATDGLAGLRLARLANSGNLVFDAAVSKAACTVN